MTDGRRLYWDLVLTEGGGEYRSLFACRVTSKVLGIGAAELSWGRGFTEIGYVPKSRVIFKKNR